MKDSKGVAQQWTAEDAGPYGSATMDRRGRRSLRERNNGPSRTPVPTGAQQWTVEDAGPYGASLVWLDR